MLEKVEVEGKHIGMTVETLTLVERKRKNKLYHKNKVNTVHNWTDTVKFFAHD